MQTILFIESGTSGGGSFESLYQYLCVINRQKYRPIVVFFNDNRFTEFLTELGITFYIITHPLYSKNSPPSINRFINLAAHHLKKYVPWIYLISISFTHKPVINKLEWIIKENKVDLLYLNDQINRDLFCLVLVKRTEVKCISHLRSIDGQNFEPYACFANKNISTYIANSEFTKNYWIKKGVDPNKTITIYNSIENLNIEPINIHNYLKLNNNQYKIKFIGYVGRLVFKKNLAFLLKVFDIFNQKFPDSLLIIVGDGPMRKVIENAATALGIEKSIVFTGYLNNAKEIIASLDLLVLPSIVEEFGRVLIEAMQLCTPVVAANSGGIPEVIKHEYNGLLAKPDDEKEFCKAIERMLFDESLRAKCIKNGHKTTIEKFGIKQYANKIEKIYKKVLAD